MTTPKPAITFDARPLTDPVDPKAVSAFVAEMRARRTGGGVGMILGIVAGVLALAIAVPILIASFTMVASRGFPGLSMLPFAIFGVVFIAVGLTALFSHRRGREARYRLSRFAAANNMTYEDRVDNPALPGMIFQHGNGRRSTMLVRGHSPRFVEFGNYQYTVKHGKSSTTYRWGYVAVKLDVPLPNIVLDAVGNNGFGSNLPSSFDKDQHLSLEGDFDRYFTLYCPEGYERDALYLFTPDIMARFIDNAAELDVEIVDDWLFLYSKRQASTLDPATWAWLFGAVGALITKFDQWARWRDDRLRVEHASPGASSAATPTGAAESLPFAPPVGMITPPPGVAPSGRRLKRRTGWMWIVVIVMVIAINVWARAF
ncbi:hypothetical protein OED01_16200 [Microbacterium sp. M28]|uniref:hypothetical protein n=1 Tax=Microbacterium sp. M28 TaxID=2962064 RepID=UPI0021F48A8C|nr:hypothetical protein [Microbacterium sp. M28]UYO97121.1 hypothetical protein OED01_16200 [Microbacterium sp. M28]